ncbi:hypothetical protein ACD571_04440 [Campylobacter sp. LH-2024]|uniref:hypothetical protein n=1 Tax=Campylobacter sp. LH-2024 TaxID=3239825 RepID=UPI003AA7D7E0
MIKDINLNDIDILIDSKLLKQIHSFSNEYFIKKMNNMAGGVIMDFLTSIKIQKIQNRH